MGFHLDGLGRGRRLKAPPQNLATPYSLFRQPSFYFNLTSHDRQTNMIASVATAGRPSAPTSAANRAGGRFLFWIAATAIVAGGGYAGVRSLSTSLGGQTAESYTTHLVRRSNLVVSVVEDGNIESASNDEVRCQVAGGSTILWIVDDGSQVEEGDEIVRLDSATIEESITAQRIAYEKALALKIQAEKNLSAAKIAVEEYRDGIFIQELQICKANVTVAKQNLKAAEDALEHARRMNRKGFVTDLEREAKEQSVVRAQLELDAAETAQRVLETYTRRKTLEDLEAQVEAAEATLRGEIAALDGEESKLKRLELQLANCSIKAPNSGMAIFANDMGGGRRFGGDGPQIEEGASVREGQSIIKIPDLSQMEVKVMVHESKVANVKPGMKAEVRVRDDVFQGEVTSVATRPEPSSFFSGNVKEYAARIRIEGSPEGLRPGMTAEVEIFVETRRKVVTVPVSAVYETGGERISWVLDENGKPERRLVALGQSNATSIEIRDGILEGESVILTPRVLEAKYQRNRKESGETDAGTADASEASDAAAEAPGPEGEPAADGSSEPDSAMPKGGPPGPGGPGAEAGPPAGGAPAGAEERRGGGRDPNAWKEYDSDGDGKLSKDEAAGMPGPIAQFFDNIDGNGDGFLEASEFSAARQRRGGGGQ